MICVCKYKSQLFLTYKYLVGVVAGLNSIFLIFNDCKLVLALAQNPYLIKR